MQYFAHAVPSVECFGPFAPPGKLLPILQNPSTMKPSFSQWPQTGLGTGSHNSNSFCRLSNGINGNMLQQSGSFPRA